MKILNKLSAALKNTNAEKNDDNDTYTPILAEEDYPFKSDVEVIEMPKSAIKPVETQKNAEIHIIQFTEIKPVEVQRVSLNKEQAYKMGWHYKRKSNNCLRITRYTGKSQDITLPAEIDGFIVNEIGKEVFNRKNIITVEIPDTIRKIGTGAFECSDIKKVTFAEGVKIISNNAFSCCDNLNSVHLPNTLEKIGNSAFESCRNLTNIIAPCCDIGEDAFAHSGLENFFFEKNIQQDFRLFDGSALRGTPLHHNSALILFPYSDTQNSCNSDYNIALVGRLVKVKFPQGTTVYMGKNSVASGCTLDFSKCGRVETDENSIHLKRNEHGIISSYPICNFVMPENSHIYFPDFVNAKYADGTKYKGIFDVISDDDGTEIIRINSDKLPAFSLNNYQTKNLLLMSDKPVRFYENAVSGWNLQSFSIDRLYGEGRLFRNTCYNLHKVEFNGKFVYIPCEGFHSAAHEQLLNAFSGRIKKGRFEFFDSGIFKQVFCENIDSYSNCFYWSRKKHIQLSRKNKIMLAVDVLRSSAELFPDRAFYENYLHTKQDYAEKICDKLPKEYSDFLIEFYLQ